MPTPIGRRPILRAGAAGLLALPGCLGGSNTPTFGSVVVENDGEERFETTVTVVDGTGTELLDRTFSVDPGEVERTEAVVEDKGTYQVRAAVGEQRWEQEVRFQRDGPDGEPIYGYVLVYLTGPPVDLTISRPPDATETDGA